jgi:hypothetical protein
LERRLDAALAILVDSENRLCDILTENTVFGGDFGLCFQSYPNTASEKVEQ